MTYTTKQGDLWDLISYQQLGSCKYTERLIDANRAYVSTVIFKAGVVLTLPTITAETRTAKMPPWRATK